MKIHWINDTDRWFECGDEEAFGEPNAINPWSVSCEGCIDGLKKRGVYETEVEHYKKMLEAQVRRAESFLKAHPNNSNFNASIIGGAIVDRDMSRDKMSSLMSIDGLAYYAKHLLEALKKVV